MVRAGAVPCLVQILADALFLAARLPVPEVEEVLTADAGSAPPSAPVAARAEYAAVGEPVALGAVMSRLAAAASRAGVQYASRASSDSVLEIVLVSSPVTGAEAAFGAAAWCGELTEASAAVYASAAEPIASVVTIRRGAVKRNLVPFGVAGFGVFRMKKKAGGPPCRQLHDLVGWPLNRGVCSLMSTITGLLGSAGPHPVNRWRAYSSSLYVADLCVRLWTNITPLAPLPWWFDHAAQANGRPIRPIRGAHWYSPRILPIAENHPAIRRI
jgi:hypothetical protein